MTDFITPPSLEPGDTVAIVSPASGLATNFPHVYERGPVGESLSAIDSHLRQRCLTKSNSVHGWSRTRI